MYLPQFWKSIYCSSSDVADNSQPLVSPSPTLATENTKQPSLKPDHQIQFPNPLWA